MNIFFPTTDFLGKIEITNNGLLEEKYDKDQLFFSILNNPSYVNNKLAANFNNKIHRFFNYTGQFKQLLYHSRICFYEYQTLYYQNHMHMHIAEGSLSWTLAYYFATINAVYKSYHEKLSYYEDVIISGDIGNYTDWNNISNVEKIEEKIIVSIKQFLNHKEFEHKDKILFLYKGNGKIKYDYIQKISNQDMVIEEFSDLVKIKINNKEIHIVKIDSTEDILNIIYKNRWPKKKIKVKKTSNEKNKLMILYSIIFLLSLFLSVKILNLDDLFFSKKREFKQKINSSKVLKIDPYVLVETKYSLRDSMSPNGYLIYGVILNDKNGKWLNDSSGVSKIEIIHPDGKNSSLIRPHHFFSVEQEKYWNGYLKLGMGKYQRNLWVALNFNYSTVNLPEKGMYTFVVTDINGSTFINTTPFWFEEKDPIQGFPKNIKYNQKNGLITWEGTKGQQGYYVYIYNGKKEGSEKLHNLFYVSFVKKGFNFIKKNQFILNKKVRQRFVKGESYYIIIKSHDSFEGTLTTTNFLHTQEHSDEIAQFVVE